MIRSASKLRQELKSAGAKDEELGGLVEISYHLKRLKPAAVFTKLHRPMFRRRAWLLSGAALVLGLTAGTSVVSFAQTSLPGNALYPVKTFSEKVAVTTVPNYRATVMMRRAQEVNELVTHHAAPELVLTTLNRYKTVAAGYRPQKANYQAFVYCKTSLQQAQAFAGGSERQAIAQSVAAIPDIE